jgi:hypothetical protein
MYRVVIKKINRLMLFWGKISVYSKNHEILLNTIRGQNAKAVCT